MKTMSGCACMEVWTLRVVIVIRKLGIALNTEIGDRLHERIMIKNIEPLSFPSTTHTR